MSAADGAAPLTAADAETLFGALSKFPVLVLAVSGGPDSTAMLVLAARWRKKRRRGPELVAVTVDHGLRPEAAAEAKAVGRLARSLGVEHRTLRWTGRKPKTGMQEAARLARYRLLGEAARKLGSSHVVTAHTRDDQAETVVMRLVRGSGVAGLSGMAGKAPLPGPVGSDIWLVRPLLDVPKRRLVATLRAAKIPYADDPTNRDPRYTRPRLRTIAPALSGEGLTMERLVLLARRVRRAEIALEQAVDCAAAEIAPPPWPARGPIGFAAGRFAELPAEVALRLLGRAVACVGNEGPVELGKLEALHESLVASEVSARFRRTLAGALVTRSGSRLTVERAPPRRAASKLP